MFTLKSKLLTCELLIIMFLELNVTVGENLIFNEGESFTISCPSVNDSWLVTYGGQTSTVAVCWEQYRNCDNKEPTSYIASFDNPLDTRSFYLTGNKLTYLQVLQTRRDLTRIQCGNLTWNVQVNVSDNHCPLNDLYFTANSRSDVINVHQGSRVDFLCKTPAHCLGLIAFDNGNTIVIVNSQQLPGLTTYVMNSFNCSSSFEFWCFFPQDMASHKKIKVNVSPCVSPDVSLSINNFVYSHTDICIENGMTIHCQYFGKSSAMITLYWRRNFGINQDLGRSTNNLTYTIDGDMTSFFYPDTDNWIGCRHDVTYSTTETRFRVKYCEVPTTNQPVKSRGKPYAIIIGVTLSTAFMLFLIAISVIVYCKRHQLSHRRPVRHVIPETRTDVELDSGHCSEPPRYTEIFHTDHSSLQTGSSPSPELSTLPPSYDDVIQFYKNNSQGVIEYILVDRSNI